MTDNLKDIRFVKLPANRKIGDVVLKNDIPLPVQYTEDQNPQDLNLNSIVAGLIKVLAYEPENENTDYYRTLLLAMQPNCAEELSTAAVAKTKAKDYRFALELMLAVKTITKAPESYVNLAVLYAQMTVDSHKKKADTTADMYDDKILEVLQQCMEEHPTFAAAYSEISAFHLRHGDVESARDSLARYVELETDSQKLEQAKATLKTLNRMISSQDQILYAYDKMMMGCADEAVDVLNTFLKENGPSWEALFIRGWAKRVLEDFDGAQNDLLESLRLDGKNPEVYNELSLCARERGEVELAKSYLQIAIDLDDENIVYLTNLATLNLADGEYLECRELLEKSRSIDPEDPSLKYLMEEYQKKTGDKFGPVISEDIYTDEDFDELKKKDKEENRHRNEI